ncbi:MAG: dipeptide epimerase [Cyanobacteria bacterium J06643_13]
MQFKTETFTVHKKFALRISRGTTAESTNVWLRISQDNIEGWGEASPFSIKRDQPKDTASLLAELARITPVLARFHPLQRQEILAQLQQLKVSSSIKAAIDTALHDWLGKKAGLPLWQIWGLDDTACHNVPLSVTIGICTPEQTVARFKNWQETIEPKILKLKLGNPEGIEADQLAIEAIRQVNPQIRITVDANGGWSFEDAVYMSQWLEQQGVEYIEQPLPVELDHQLEALSKVSPLPIFADESCFTSADIPRLAPSVAGVNLKIMKTGGLTEAIRAIQIAQACSLKIMFGCYSDSILANTAMAHLAPYADYLDLDSHLNLKNDPFVGAAIKEGCLIPNHQPGLGVALK